MEIIEDYWKLLMILDVMRNYRRLWENIDGSLSKLLVIIEVAPKSLIISCPVGRIGEVGLLE